LAECLRQGAPLAAANGALFLPPVAAPRQQVMNAVTRQRLDFDARMIG